VTHAENAPIFWMGGRLATDLVAVSHDAADLDDGGFWAISTDFEGGFIGAKFATVLMRIFLRVHGHSSRVHGAAPFHKNSTAHMWKVLDKLLHKVGFIK